MALLSSMVNQNIQNLDIVIIASDGVSIPANRTILAWQSKYLAQVRKENCCLQIETKIFDRPWRVYLAATPPPSPFPSTPSLSRTFLQ